MQTKGIKVQMIKKLEITYNEETNTYHPHFHIIYNDNLNVFNVQTKKYKQYLKSCTLLKIIEKAGATISDSDRKNLGSRYNKKYDKITVFQSQYLLYYWLQQFSAMSTPSAQDIRQADTKSTKELFKYFTKIYKTKTGKDSDITKAVKYINLDFFYHILNAISGRRIIQPVGIKALSEHFDKEQNEIQYLQQSLLLEKESSKALYDFRNISSYKDWYHSNEYLTNFIPGNRVNTLAENITGRGIDNYYLTKNIVTKFDRLKDEMNWNILSDREKLNQ